jgi:hypothetical protein
MLHIDVPEHRLLHSVPQNISGWLLGGDNANKPKVFIQGHEYPAKFFPRPDVENAFPGTAVLGFSLWIDATSVALSSAGNDICLVMRNADHILGEARFRLSRPLLRTSSAPLMWSHIPKTAGTALWECLSKCFPPQTIIRIYEDDSGLPLERLQFVPNAQIQQVELIFGHFGYGTHKYLDVGHPRYATVLRDPIDLLSSFLAFSSSVLQTDPFLDNPLVRYMSGVGYDLPHGMIEEQHLSAAIENLEKHFDHVGFTSRLDETIQWLSVQYDVPLTTPSVVNATGKRFPLPLPQFCKVDHDLALYRSVRTRAA